MIASNLPVSQLTSDFEILAALIDGGGIAGLSALLDDDSVNDLAKALLTSNSHKSYAANRSRRVASVPAGTNLARS